MATYSSGRAIELGIPAELGFDAGTLPDAARNCGATGRGVAVELVLPSGQGQADYAVAWAQPCIVAGNLLDPLGGVQYWPIGGAGQLVIPGNRYAWTRRELGADALVAGSSAALQIDVGIAVWRRRGRQFLTVRFFRLD